MAIVWGVPNFRIFMVHYIFFYQKGESFLSLNLGTEHLNPPIFYYLEYDGSYTDWLWKLNKVYGNKNLWLFPRKLTEYYVLHEALLIND